MSVSASDPRSGNNPSDPYLGVQQFAVVIGGNFFLKRSNNFVELITPVEKTSKALVNEILPSGYLIRMPV